MAPEWNVENVDHLLRRVQFGVTQADRKKALKRGFEKTLKTILKPPKTKPAKFPKKAGELDDLQGWWIRSLSRSKQPLADKLTLLWHNHFATGAAKVGVELMFRQIDTLRRFGMGSFRDLVLEVSRDPAMLIWLDNKDNFVGNLNENYARELMELFTTGVLDKNGAPNYTEQDVVEVARAFTGWTLEWDDELVFVFVPQLHDEGVKTVKGVTGNLDGTDVVDLLAADAATARRVAWRLFSFFAHPVDLDDPLLDPLEAEYLATGGDISAILESLFRSDAFYSPSAKRARVQSPAEFLASSARLLRGKFHPKHLYPLGLDVQRLGQSLYNPPSVFGWKEGLNWVETSGMLARAQVGASLADSRGGDSPLRYKPARLLGKKGQWKTLTPADVVDRVLTELGLSDASEGLRNALIAYVQSEPDGSPIPPEEFEVDGEFVDVKVRGVIALALASPEHQML